MYGLGFGSRATVLPERVWGLGFLGFMASEFKSDLESSDFGYGWLSKLGSLFGYPKY